jgi:DNA-directed RNA polymerase specialized sigma24 family protein
MGTVTWATPAGLSFDEVCRLHGAALHRFCMVALGHPEAAEAAAAQILAAVAQSYPLERPASAGVLRWLFGVACEVIGELPPARRGRRAPGAVATGWGRDVDEALVRAAALGSRERLATGLRCAAGLEYSEIGEILGVRADAAQEACARGLRRIRPAGGRAR